MAQNKATARETVSHLFGATTAAAQAVGTTFNTLGDTVEMAHEFVSNAKRKQTFRNLAEGADYEARTIEEIAASTADRRAQLEKRMDSDESFKKHYSSAHKEILNAVYGKEETSE